jgi:hypothetical protein
VHLRQVYIDRPFCASGYKLDLRLYVLVASARPLRVYLYHDCLLRVATQPYDLNDLQNAISHLTNSSINKHSDSLGSHKAGIGAGCKVSYRAWLRQNPDSRLRSPLLWARIRSILCLTLLSIASQMPDAVGCFELLGYDVIVDENLKPWLLEVGFLVPPFRSASGRRRSVLPAGASTCISWGYRPLRRSRRPAAPCGAWRSCERPVNRMPVNRMCYFCSIILLLFQLFHLFHQHLIPLPSSGEHIPRAVHRVRGGQPGEARPGG